MKRRQHISTDCVIAGTEKDAGARHNWARRSRNVSTRGGGSGRYETRNYDGESGQSLNGVSFAVVYIFTSFESFPWNYIRCQSAIKRNGSQPSFSFAAQWFVFFFSCSYCLAWSASCWTIQLLVVGTGFLRLSGSYIFASVWLLIFRLTTSWQDIWSCFFVYQCDIEYIVRRLSSNTANHASSLWFAWHHFHTLSLYCWEIKILNTLYVTH